MASAVTSVSLIANADLASTGSVRRLVVAAVDSFDAGVDPEVVAVLTSEVFTNAVRAGNRDIKVRVDRLPGPAVRVEVVDDGAGWPMMARPEPLDDGGGRGLLIVNALAHAWGATTDGDSGLTTVWFELLAETPAVG